MQDRHPIHHITDQITLVVLGVNIWSGRKKLRPEDLKLGTEIPPEDLVSLGSKRICNPEALKEFHRLKKVGERACLHLGTRFLGGFAVPNCHAESLADKLETVKAAFDAETQTFLSGYDQALEEWISSLPAWEEPIRRAIEPANVVGGRLRFGFQLVQIAPADQPGTLEQEVNGLGDGIFAEVEQMARELDESFEGKEKLHRRALGTFRRIREKLACLSFIDQRIAPVVDTIDDWFARVPLEGPIEGAIFNEGMGLALLLGDSKRMARHGAGQRAMQTGETMPEHDEETGAVTLDEAPVVAETAAPPAPELSFDEELDVIFGAESVTSDTPQAAETTDDLPRALPAVEEKEEEVLAVDDGGGFFF
ncbi:DUF3150 domain-containing protein [uncultured Thiodictyon sp.]|uniref:DUF3150 domain-containing protein n=1 Tax=uncultured Thiodictyon sp. TaxID=1846217 RepID=UPI0025D54148|nr:DUF3150 domain-containing protein [uncultured Thiodictyon sp.]